MLFGDREADVSINAEEQDTSCNSICSIATGAESAPAAHARGMAPLRFETCVIPGTSLRRRLVIPVGGGDGKVDDHIEEGENKDEDVIEDQNIVVTNNEPPIHPEVPLAIHLPPTSAAIAEQIESDNKLQQDEVHRMLVRWFNDTAFSDLPTIPEIPAGYRDGRQQRRKPAVLPNDHRYHDAKLR